MAKKQLGDGTSKPKLSFTVGVLGDTSAHESKGETKFFQGVGVAEEIEVEEMLAPAMIISRLNHPVTLSYEGFSMIIAPRGREKIANMSKLGALPKGVFVTPIQVA